MDRTLLWENAERGHWFAIGPDGMTLNGKPVSEPPDWLDDRSPDMVFGALIPWPGGECPVPHDRIVRCIFRGRRPYIGQAIWPELPLRGKAAMWAHAPSMGRTEPAYDIIGYQERVA